MNDELYIKGGSDVPAPFTRNLARFLVPFDVVLPPGWRAELHDNRQLVLTPIEREDLSPRSPSKLLLLEALNAVQAFSDMVNVIQRVGALPLPSILEGAQHNCPIIIEHLTKAIEELG